MGMCFEASDRMVQTVKLNRSCDRSHDVRSEETRHRDPRSMVLKCVHGCLRGPQEQHPLHVQESCS